MKAHIIKDSSKKNTSAPKTIQITGKGPYHGHPIRLSIGLIVKNEEKTLDRCLSSLQPLMQAVESELIITDTGSTDRTVEIAKKYTDHIIHFQWCNDFAAARNTGLKEARGEWFMFLDSDEWFEDTSDLIRFFTSGECDKYGSAAYIIRNYQDLSGKKYSQFHAMRLCRMYPGIHFQNVIHEAIARIAPTKFISDYAHHYGYVFYNQKKKNEKFHRNRELLEQEIERKPEDLRAYLLLAQQYMQVDSDMVEKYCNLGLQQEEKQPNRTLRLALQQVLAQIYFLSKKYEKTLELAENVLHNDSKTEVIWLDLHGYAQLAAFALGEYERSIRHGEAYLKVYDRYRSGGINQELTLIAFPNYNLPKHREQVLCFLAKACLRLKRFDKAQKFLNQLDFSNETSMKHGIPLVYQICRKTDKWELLSNFYRKICLDKEDTSMGEICQSLEDASLESTEKEKDAVQAFASIPDDTDPYVHMNRLRKAEMESERDSALKELDWFFQWEGEWKPAFSDVLFYGMKEKLDLTIPISKIEMNELAYYTANMQERHDDYVQTIKKYFQCFSAKTVQGICWSLALLERVILTDGQRLQNQEQLELFEDYARLSAQYSRMLYRPEVLNSVGVSVLPPANRFGYYMGLALSARDKSDDTTYIANLRLALHSYPAMKKPISLLLEQFQQTDKERREKAEEFNMLAKQVKERIRAMIAQGKLKEAGQVTMQLAALLPNDPDVIHFQELTHTQPEMNEIAAHLPQ